MKAQSNPYVKHAVELALFLAKQATKALIDEARLSPKPGLVDSRGNGAHQDLNLELMIRSATSLTGTFYDMAILGFRQPISPSLRSQIGEIGRQGECQMLEATNGVNTHRGAIWALGLLVTALASLDQRVAVTTVTQLAGRLAMLSDNHFTPKESNGLRVCQRFNVPGAREEAQQGFPHIINQALPMLLLSRQRGDSEMCAQVNALLAIMRSLSDTCILSRGGMPALIMVQQGAQAVLDAGGVQTKQGQLAFDKLEQQMLACHVSPGGAADLLAATLFLDRTTIVDNESIFKK